MSAAPATGPHATGPHATGPDPSGPRVSDARISDLQGTGDNPRHPATGLSLTAADPADAPALARILGGWVAETPWLPKRHSPAQDLGFVAGLIAQDDVVVARNGSVPLGFLARCRPDILALYLAPGARGQGIGPRLLAHAQAARPELWLWTFQANTGAIRFYRRAGFAEDHRPDGAANDERPPDLRLVWRKET